MFYDVELVEFWTRPGRFRALFYRALQKQHQSNNKSQSKLRKTLEVASENSKQRGTWGVLNTATPQTKQNKHRITARNIINTPTPQDLLGLNVFFFFFFFLKKRNYRYFYFSNTRNTSQDNPTAFSACKIPCCRLHLIMNEVQATLR